MLLSILFGLLKEINLLRTKNVIGVDIDGVLADYPNSFIEYVEKKTGYFFVDLKRIVDGRFIHNNKLYDGNK